MCIRDSTDIKGTLDVTGISTFGNNIDANGDLDVDGRTELDITNISETLNVTGVSTFGGNVTVGTGATVGFGTTVYFRDNAKAVFGDSEDLEIFHDGLESKIWDNGVGGLVLQTGGSPIELRAINQPDNEIMLKATPGGSIDLYENGTKRFETISTGASFYNKLNVASLNGGTSGLSSHFGSLRYGNESGAAPYSTRRSLDLINTDTGNVNFYLNLNNISGPAGNFVWFKADTPKMTLVANTGNLGIGKTNPTEKLHVAGIITTTSSLFVATDLSVKGNLEMTGASSQIIAQA